MLTGAEEKLGMDFLSVCDYCLLVKVCWGQLTQGWRVSKGHIKSFWSLMPKFDFELQKSIQDWHLKVSWYHTSYKDICLERGTQFLLMSSEHCYPGTQPESLSLFHITDFVFTTTVAPERNYKTPTCQVSPAWWPPLNQTRLRRDQEDSLWKTETGITTIHHCHPDHY